MNQSLNAAAQFWRPHPFGTSKSFLRRRRYASRRPVRCDVVRLHDVRRTLVDPTRWTKEPIGMDCETVDLRLIGTKRLVMNNGQLTDPLAVATKALARVTGKRVKTGADHLEIG